MIRTQVVNMDAHNRVRDSDRRDQRRDEAVTANGGDELCDLGAKSVKFQGMGIRPVPH